MNSLVGAFGSIIGYLGAEAVDTSIFEALLWPQRYYNRNTLRSGLTSTIPMPLGGPLHKSALSTLDQIRPYGLYLSQSAGHMLDKTFFPDHKF